MITYVDYRTFERKIENKMFTFASNVMASNIDDELNFPKINIDSPMYNWGLTYIIFLLQWLRIISGAETFIILLNSQY